MEEEIKGLEYTFEDWKWDVWNEEQERIREYLER